MAPAMTKLSVNINKVATLRNTRPLDLPSVVKAARLCLEAGAEGITVHPRPDQRHIRSHDVDDVARLLKDYPRAEYNIEGNPFFDEYMRHAERVRPKQCTLVPDTVEASTSDHGWDLARDAERLRPVIAELKSFGCRVSLFMDADSACIPLVRELGADRIELYTAPYAESFGTPLQGPTVAQYRQAALIAAEEGLGVNAGHDLSQDNLGAFLTGVPNVLEVSIGHALIAEALEVGLPETVRRYLRICTSS
ncbi:pyridoxine 5'-phosphate synthase [Planctomyces sp. SH-PL14]|uniref:pyridoxine 5'-phosphate synthase n=1 Tax=Planctomyces sp. SH-PL14 TaxID=1632864 RepID=UPI00094687FE|nr:pyridoxine 5'-phosphate synthase [Planctomyces sp. SH-PL14]